MDWTERAIGWLVSALLKDIETDLAAYFSAGDRDDVDSTAAAPTVEIAR